MSYSITIKASARKELVALDRQVRAKVIAAIDGLGENPFRGSTLKGDLIGLRRVRVGDYRVVYEVGREKVCILVIKVGHRREVYR